MFQKHLTKQFDRFDLNVLPKLSLLKSTVAGSGGGQTNLLRFLAGFIDHHGSHTPSHHQQLKATSTPHPLTSSCEDAEAGGSSGGGSSGGGGGGGGEGGGGDVSNDTKEETKVEVEVKADDDDEANAVPPMKWFDELGHIRCAAEASFDRAAQVNSRSLAMLVMPAQSLHHNISPPLQALLACEKIVTHAQRVALPVSRKPVYTGSHHGDGFLAVIQPFIA